MNRAVPCVARAALLLVCVGSSSVAQILTADGTDFVLVLEDGRVLRSFELVGATIHATFGDQMLDIRVDAVEQDPSAVGGPIFLHHFVRLEADGRQSDLCEPDSFGRSAGFPVPTSGGGFELVCTNGAIAKCIIWGYRFWEEQPGGPPLHALHDACVHMVRADYGGDGTATTNEGTLIDFWDRYGIQSVDGADPVPFEAGWGVDGAACVAHPRIAGNISLAEIGARSPRLRGKLGPQACTEESAWADRAALLFNRSQE